MQKCTESEAVFQIPMDENICPPVGWLALQAGLSDFQQRSGEWNVKPNHGMVSQTFYGSRVLSDEDRICPHCGAQMHRHDKRTVFLKHLPIGSATCGLCVQYDRLSCPCCSCRWSPPIRFQSDHHRITIQLENYIEDLLAMGHTLKDVQNLTGVHRHIVKEIDKRRLLRRYTEPDGTLIKPERQARILGIDEFSLHKGQQYATVILDMETGHILWLQHTKCKGVVQDFISHVGEEWMAGVEALCCDMNAQYPRAFQEQFPHIAIVYDRFHIVKNFNDHVISNVRKDEQRRLEKEGDAEGAKQLKRSRYILTANRSTLQKRDQQAGQPVRKDSDIFSIIPGSRTGGREARYDRLIAENRLLFTIDLVKEALAEAYMETDTAKMREKVEQIIDICRETDNRHFSWFANLPGEHIEGIVTHAEYQLSSGRVEGTVNLIKTIRRKGYGYPDDEYLFLKLFDASRR